jgi:hypothetical protein
MCDAGALPQTQREDILGRVREHLQYVAVQRRVNPREVKRFINSYTLQMLIGRDGLDANVILVLQTIAARPDWEDAYDVLQEDPERFREALREFRDSREHAAFESRFPGLRRFPEGLTEYLTSTLARPLADVTSLEDHLSSLGSASGVNPWYAETLGALSALSRTLDAFSNTNYPQSISEIALLAERVSRLIRRPEIKHPETWRIQESWRRAEESVNDLTDIKREDYAESANRIRAQDRLGRLQEQVELLRMELRMLRDSER